MTISRNAALVLALAGAACGSADAPPPATPMAAPAEAAPAETNGTERDRIHGPFLADNWEHPVPHQGEPPPAWSEAEASLEPAVCGACHPEQLAQWKTSLHAAAFSPGFAGQLLEGSLAAPHQVRNCQTCHTPLAEQQPYGPDHAPEPAFDAGLREQGIVCASCHVRAHRRHGPERRAELPPPEEPVPHGGFEVRDEFGQSRFCATCHQFFDDEGVNGKPVENTYAEWKASPQAAEGQTCQSCHMPDRAHVWRGIHDPEMVRSGVEIAFQPLDLATDVLRAALVLANTGVGHAFPSYTTPRVFLAVWQVDAAGEEIEGTRVDATIGRELDFSTWPWSENFDTRVLPGESAKLDYASVRHERAVAVVGRVTVDPAYHYRGVFDRLRQSYETEEARAQMERAFEQAQTVSYVLEELRLPLGS